jgi:ribosomal protein S2
MLVNKNILKNKIKLFEKINLNCSQIIQSNIILGHSIKDYNKNISKYFIISYNNKILFNFFWIFSNLQKNLVFLINIYLKNYNIFYFSSNLLTNEFDIKTIYIFKKINWIKGIISNQKYVYNLIRRRKKYEVPKFPGYFFVINKEKKDFKNLITEFKKVMLPLTIIVDSNIHFKNLDDILYVIPGNDNSVAFSNWFFKLILNTKMYCKNLKNLKIIHNINI